MELDLLADVVATAVGDGASDVPGASGMEGISGRSSVAAAPALFGADIQFDGSSSNVCPGNTAGSLAASTPVDGTDCRRRDLSTYFGAGEIPLMN